MKKLLLIIPFIFSIACINTVRAEEMCSPETCQTTRDEKIVGKCVENFITQTTIESNFCVGLVIQQECGEKRPQKCTIQKGTNVRGIYSEIKCKPQTETVTYIIEEWTEKGFPNKVKKEAAPGTECTSDNPHSEYAECQYIRHNGGDVMSCVAKKCKKPYHLWFHDNKGTGKNSMGVCRSDKEAQNYCLKWCTSEYKDKNCTPILNGGRTTKTHKGKTYKLNDAFVGCQPEKHTDPTISPLPPLNPDQPNVKPEITEQPNLDDKFGLSVVCDPETRKCSPMSIFMDIDLKLNKYFAQGSSSVWKNDEGKFNTARLASDSIAGVVLGTVGGVITSNVIKKNQVENGFEDLKCTIGGQTVATFGDEFTVGIR